MKPCTYCGRENEHTATHCGECGTEFAAPVAETEPEPLLNSGALKTFITVVGVMFLGISLYLLSFGPVFRWTATVTTTPPPTALTTMSTNGTTVVYSRTISFPRWVRVVYYPAFTLMRGKRGTCGHLYYCYVDWWRKPSP